MCTVRYVPHFIRCVDIFTGYWGELVRTNPTLLHIVKIFNEILFVRTYPAKPVLLCAFSYKNWVFKH